MKIIVHCETGTCGTESHDFYIVPDDWTEDKIYEFCWECALQNAETYGIYNRGDYLDEDDIEGDEYSDGIEGHYEVYDPKLHDKYMIGGGDSPSFMDLTK